MIDEYKFGSFVINGRVYVDDIKIIDKKVKYWQNRDGHDLRLEDIKEILAARPEFLVIGCGASGLLKVSDEIRELLARNRVKVFVDKNPKACEVFNRALLENRKVAAIFHGTC